MFSIHEHVKWTLYFYESNRSGAYYNYKFICKHSFSPNISILEMLLEMKKKYKEMFHLSTKKNPFQLKNLFFTGETESSEFVENDDLFSKFDPQKLLNETNLYDGAVLTFGGIIPIGYLD